MKPLTSLFVITSFCFVDAVFADETPTPAPSASMSTTPVAAATNAPMQIQQQQDAIRRLQQQRNMRPGLEAGQATRLKEMQQRKAQMDALHGQPSAGNTLTRVAPDTKATPSSAVSPTATPQPSASAAKENPKN